MVVEGVQTTALLDSGSQVSTIPEWFVHQYWPDRSPDSLSSFLDVEDAGGNSLSYSGVFDLDLQPFTGSSVVVPTPFLVVKDTRYNKFTPLVIGTNVIDYLANEYPDETELTSRPWASVCKASEFRRSIGTDGTIGVVRCLKQVVVPSQSQVTVHGAIRAGPIGQVLGLTENGDYCTLPSGLVLIPSVSKVTSHSKSATRVSVRIHNLTTKTVTIPTKTELCELRQVSLVSPSEVFTDEVSTGESDVQSPPIVQ